MSLSWFLALVLLMGQAEAQFCNKITLGTNLARGRPALQSSVLPHEFVPSAIKAVDGDCSADFGHGSCTHTQADNNPWWFVDLGASYTVAAVVVYNRADCCDLRLQGAEVRVGDAMNASDHGRSNPLCGVIEKPNGSANTVRCKWLKGRYVSIHLPRHSAYLTLCEVEVYGLPAENQC